MQLLVTQAGMERAIDMNVEALQIKDENKATAQLITWSEDDKENDSRTCTYIGARGLTVKELLP